MSQDISTNHSTSEPVAESFSSIKPWSAETYAEQLMDDLFADIDRILEGGSKLPTEPAKPDYVSLQPVKIPQITKPPVVMPSGPVQAQPDDTANADKPPEKSDIPPATSSGTRARGIGQYFDKILLGAACGSLVLTLILWWVSYKKQSLPSWLNFAANPVSQSTLSPSDAQFINYMQRSLELIDRKAQASRQQINPDETAARPAGVQSVPSQPSPTVGSNLPQAPNPVPTVAGILPGYYPPPQYQQPLQIAPPAPPAPSTIRPPAVSAIRPPTANAIRPTATTPVSPQPPQPSQSPVARGPVAAPAPTKVVPTPSSSPTPAVSEPKHTLVGLLYLGDRSAALFDISGVTQRIQVGEPIGSSGWTLVAVTKDEALIRRNGEVRSIYAGQKF